MARLRSFAAPSMAPLRLRRLYFVTVIYFGRSSDLHRIFPAAIVAEGSAGILAGGLSGLDNRAAPDLFRHGRPLRWL